MPRPLTGQGLFKAGNPEKWPEPGEFLRVRRDHGTSVPVVVVPDGKPILGTGSGEL